MEIKKPSAEQVIEAIRTILDREEQYISFQEFIIELYQLDTTPGDQRLDSSSDQWHDSLSQPHDDFYYVETIYSLLYNWRDEHIETVNVLTKLFADSLNELDWE